jgi:NAD(P)H dehydrogenase (quinone)
MSESVTRLLVCGASGKLGRRVAELLMDEWRPDRLILVTRAPETLTDLADRGADVRFGDYAQPESLPEALAGAERMLLISASDLAVRSEQHQAAIRVAAEVGVRHIVYTSALSPEPPNPAAIAPSHYATERALAESGLAWTVLRNSLYAEYQVPDAVRALSAGVLLHNRGDGRIAYVSREDCATVAAAVMMGSRHEGRVYDVTGPDLFTADGLAALYGELGGRSVKTESLDDDAFVELVQGSASEDEHARYGARLVCSLGRSIREGYMAARTDVVAQLTSRPARTLRGLLEADGSLGPDCAPANRRRARPKRQGSRANPPEHKDG